MGAMHVTVGIRNPAEPERIDTRPSRPAKPDAQTPIGDVVLRTV